MDKKELAKGVLEKGKNIYVAVDNKQREIEKAIYRAGKNKAKKVGKSALNKSAEIGKEAGKEVAKMVSEQVAKIPTETKIILGVAFFVLFALCMVIGPGAVIGLLVFTAIAFLAFKLKSSNDNKVISKYEDYHDYK